VIARLDTENESARRMAYAKLLTRVYKKPGPWVYWGYRPAPRPANTVAWDKSDAIAAALARMLADPDHAVGLAVLQRMQREKVPVRLATLGAWLRGCGCGPPAGENANRCAPPDLLPSRTCATVAPLTRSMMRSLPPPAGAKCFASGDNTA
jgi:hypothetical protein